MIANDVLLSPKYRLEMAVVKLRGRARIQIDPTSYT